MTLAVQKETEAEIRVRNCALTGVENHGPIITATITQVRALPRDLNSSDIASVVVRVDRYFRGPQLSSGSLTVPADWTDGPTRPYVMRPPGWYYVTTDPGERLLLMLISTADLEPGHNDPYDFRALCVLNLDSVSDVLPTIERLVRLDSTEDSKRVAAMENALSDGSKAIRILAVKYLTSPQVRDPDVRRFVFRHFSPIAANALSPQRGEALQAIRDAYDGFTKDSELNDEVLSFIAGTMADSDPAVRSNAIQWVYSKLGGTALDSGKIARTRLINRAEVLQQLRRDASGGIIYSNGLHEKDAEKEAAKLLQAFEESQ